MSMMKLSPALAGVCQVRGTWVLPRFQKASRA
jgi:hypothetical protein